MFDKRVDRTVMAESPASLLLMNSIVGCEEPVEITRGDSPEECSSVSRTVDEFLAAHSTAILLDPVDTVSAVEEDRDTNFSLSQPAKRLTWWQRIMATRSVGLEVSDRAIRVVKVRRWGSSQEIEMAAEDVHEYGVAEDVDMVAERLKRLMERVPLGGVPVHSILSSHDMNIRLLRMPKVSKKEIHDALLWKNKKELHFFNDAPTVLHYVILDEDQSQNDNEFHVLVVAVKEESIKRHLSILEKAGVLPARLIIRPVAQWNILRVLPGALGHTCVIDVGFERTQLTFYRNGSLQYAREVPVGGNHFTKALMQTIFVDETAHDLAWSEAEALKCEVGMAGDLSPMKTSRGIPHPEIAVMMRPVAERLFSEIRMSMDYFSEQFKVESFESVLAFGKGLRMKGLKKYLESQIGQPIHLPSAVECVVGGSADLIDAVGAALSVKSDFSFLPEHIQSEWRYRRAFRKVVQGIVLLLLTIGSAAYIQHVKISDLRTIQDQLTGSLEGLNGRLQEYESLNARHNYWMALEKSLTQETRSDTSISTALKYLSAITPKEIVLEEISWGERFNEAEQRRLETSSRMKQQGFVGTSTADTAAFRLRGAVVLDVFYADVHLLNYLNALERASWLDGVRLKEKRIDLECDAMQFEIVANRSSRP